MRKPLLIAVLLLLAYFFSARFFFFSHSIKENNFRLSLPDFVEDSHFEKEGFKVWKADAISWKKKDKFNWVINNSTFTDSFEIVAYSTWIEYPYVPRYTVYVSPEVDMEFMEFLSLDPDSLKDNVEYYTIDSKYVLQRSEVTDGVSVKKMYTVYNAVQPTGLFSFLRRLPFFLTGDAAFSINGNSYTLFSSK